MTDPAIEAAQRAWAKHKTIPFNPDCLYGKSLISTTREALKPIRELHKPIDYFEGGGYEFTCQGCLEGGPCDTAKLIYTSEELA